MNATSQYFDCELARFNMIEQQIRPWDVLDSTVLNVLTILKREQFVPPSCLNVAFSDIELPLHSIQVIDGDNLYQAGQVMLPPKLEARLLQAAQVKRTDRILEIGTGSGYMAGLLALMGHHVTTFDVVNAYVLNAQQALNNALLSNVTVQQGCGFKDSLPDSRNQLWDLIMLSGSVESVELLPQVFLNSLAIGGRLVGVFGDANKNPMMQCLRIIRQIDNTFKTEYLFDCNAPALSGLKPSSFVF